MMMIIGRPQAKFLGLPRYFTGRPCKYGHVCERSTATYQCVECVCPVHSIISEAKFLGLPRYFTGRPCKYGHVCERSTASGDCIECLRLYYEEHREERRAYQLAYRKAHREELSAKRAAKREKINSQRRKKKITLSLAERIELRALRQAIKELKSTSINLGDLL